MTHQFANALVAGLIVVAGGMTPTATDGLDQDHLGDALAASSIRMLEAGFWSVGPGTRDTEFVSGCLGGLDSPGRLPPLPGETARAVSNVYLFQPDSQTAPEVGELLTASVVTVDDANQSALDRFVLLLGKGETADCRRTEYLNSPEVGAGAADAAPVVDVIATSDLGIADASSRLDMRIMFTTAGVRHPVHYSYLVARSGRTLVVVRLATFGDGPSSGVDAGAELASIAESLSEPSG